MNPFLANIKHDWLLIYRGLKLIHQLQPYMILVCILRGLFHSIYPFIGFYFSSEIINELGKADRSMNRTITLIIFTIVCTFVCKLMMTLLSQAFDILQYMLGHKKELNMVDKGYQLDYADLDDPKVKELREKLNRGRYRRGIMGIVHQLNTLVQYIFSIIISTSLIIQMFTSRSSGTDALDQLINSPLTSCVIFMILIISIVYAVQTNAITQKRQFEIMHQTGPHYKYDTFYSYTLSTEYNAGKDIRLYSQKNLIQKEIDFHLKRIFDLEKIVPNLHAKYWTIGSFLQVIANIFTYIFVGLKALVGALDIGSIVLYTGSVTQFTNGFSGSIETLTTIKENSTYLEWFFEFMDLENRKETGTRPLDMSNMNDVKIEFKNVSFKYPGNEHYSLKNISMTLDPRKRVAVVGKNGSGKTTFIKLLCRLYDPTEGEILLNGVNIKEYNYHDYLDFFSVVFQDFKLFSCTLGENIATAAEYDHALVNECILQAGLKERMGNFPDGLDTQLYNEFSEEGVEISGGEAQKVAIARALYKDAPFIVLDEPTAALDPLAEADIYSRLNDLIKNKSAIYISHRLSSCCFCNQIAVFDQGQLAQYGTHTELLSDNLGLYNELWTAQAQYYVGHGMIK